MSKDSTQTALTKPLRGQTNVFRVQTQKQGKETVFHPRRPHLKSRSGCWNCKRRRVKCDESKPQCNRCQKHGIECDYVIFRNFPNNTTGAITQFLERFPYLTSLDAGGYSMSLKSIGEKIDELLQTKPSKRGRLDGVTSLKYFHDYMLTNDGPWSFRPPLRGKIIELAFQSPFLMHALIASSTMHLCHIVPDNTAYKATEAYHWREAISQYSNEISTNVGPHNMDALFSACIIMTFNSFALDEFNPRSSFVFSDRRESLNWLVLQSGLRHLLYIAGPWLSQSIWFDMFMASRGKDTSFEDHRPGRAGLDPEMADLCGIDDNTIEETNPYLWPLRMLTHLMPLERSLRSFSNYTNFMGRLLPEFYEKLLQKDPPALIILSWWLALMNSIQMWWMETRVKSECVAICMFLENSDDPRVLKLLEFPAEACGYLLRHVQERGSLVSCVDVMEED